MEEQRMMANEDEIDAFYDRLESILSTIHPGFCFALDEVGQHEYNDAREVFVVVRSDYTQKTCRYSVNRNYKKATALHCISTDGEYIKPMIIVPRVSIDSEIDTICPRIHYYPVHQVNGYMNTAAFNHWFTEIFIPVLSAKRTKYNYSGKAVLLMDQFVAHKNGIENIDLNQLNLEVIYLVPHTSDQTSPLDLGIFGEQKRISGLIKKDCHVSALTNQIKKIVTSLWKASDPVGFISAFRSMRIIRVTKKTWTGEKTTLVCERSKARAVRHYEESHVKNLQERCVQLTEAQKKVLQMNRLKDEEMRSFRIGLPKF